MSIDRADLNRSSYSQYRDVNVNDKFAAAQTNANEAQTQTNTTYFVVDDPTQDQIKAVQNFIADMRGSNVSDEKIAARLGVSVEQVQNFAQGHGLTVELFESIADFAKNNMAVDLRSVEYARRVDIKNVYFENKNITDAGAQAAGQRIKNGTATTADAHVVADWVAQNFYAGLEKNLGKPIAHSPAGQSGYCNLAAELSMYTFRELGAKTYNLGTDFLSAYPNVASEKFHDAHAFSLIEVPVSDSDKPLYFLFDMTQRQFDGEAAGPAQMLNKTKQGQTILNDLYRNGYAVVDEVGIETYLRSYNDNRPVYDNINDFWADAAEDADEPSTKRDIEKKQKSVEQAYTENRKARYTQSIFGSHYRAYFGLGEAMLDGFRPSLVNAQNDVVGRATQSTATAAVKPTQPIDYKTLSYVPKNVGDAQASAAAQNIQKGQATIDDVKVVSDWVAQSFYEGLAQSRGAEVAHTPYGQRGYCGLAADLALYAFGEVGAQTMDLSTHFLGVYGDEGKITFDKAHTFSVMKVDVKGSDKPVLVLFDMTLRQFDGDLNSPSARLNQSEAGQTLLNDLYTNGYAVVDEAGLDTYFRAYNDNKPIYGDFNQFWADVAKEAAEDPPHVVQEEQRQRIKAVESEHRPAAFRTVAGANRIYADLGEASLDGFRPSALHAPTDYVAQVRSGARAAPQSPDILPPEPFEFDAPKTTAPTVSNLDKSKPLDYKNMAFEPKPVSDVQATAAAQKLKNGSASEADAKVVADWVATQFHASLSQAIGADLANSAEGNKGYCGLAKKLTRYAFTEVGVQTYDLGSSFFAEFTDGKARTFQEAHVFTLVEVPIEGGKKVYYLFDPTLRQFDDMKTSPSARLNETKEGRGVLEQLYKNGYAQVDEASLKTYFNAYNDNKPVYSDLRDFWDDVDIDTEDDDYRQKFQEESKAIEAAKTENRSAKYQQVGHKNHRSYPNLGEATLDGYRPSALHATTDKVAVSRVTTLPEKTLLEKNVERYFGTVAEAKKDGRRIKINLGPGALGESKVGYIQVSLKQAPLNIRPRTYQDTEGNHWVVLEKDDYDRLLDTEARDLKYYRRMQTNELADHLKPPSDSKPPFADDFREYRTGYAPRTSADPFYNLDGTPAFPTASEFTPIDLSRPIEGQDLSRTKYPDTWPTEDVVTHEVRETQIGPTRMESKVMPTHAVDVPDMGNITLGQVLEKHVDGFAQMSPEQKASVTAEVLKLNRNLPGVPWQIWEANLQRRMQLSLDQPLARGKLILPNVRVDVEVRNIKSETVEVHTTKPVASISVYPGIDTEGSEALQRALAADGIDAEVKSVEGEIKIYPKDKADIAKIETKFGGQTTSTQIPVSGSKTGETQTALVLSQEAATQIVNNQINLEKAKVDAFVAEMKADAEALIAEVDAFKDAKEAEFDAWKAQQNSASAAVAEPATKASAQNDGLLVLIEPKIVEADGTRVDRLAVLPETPASAPDQPAAPDVDPNAQSEKAGKTANKIQKLDAKVTLGALFTTLLDDSIAWASFSMDANNPVYDQTTRAKAKEMAEYYKQKVGMLVGVGGTVAIANFIGTKILPNFIPGAAAVTKGITATVEIDLVLAQYAKGEASWTRVWTTMVAAGIEFGTTAGTSLLGLPGGILGEGARVLTVEALKFAGVPESEVATYGIMGELLKAVGQGNLGAKKAFKQMIGEDQTQRIEDNYKRIKGQK